MQFSLKNLAKLAAAGAMVVAMSAGSYADVYFRYNDGRVVRGPRAHWERYRGQGVIINALPAGYVNEPYVTVGGYPTYYHQDYWYSHHRRWRGDGDWYRHHHHHHHHHHH